VYTKSLLLSHLLNISKLNFSFEQNHVIKDVSLTVQEGKFVTLIGPNGAGKSTLLRLILGTLKPQSGKIEWAENVRIGYVPQKVHIDITLPMTVRRFMELKPAPDLMSLPVVSIDHLMDKQLHSLSGGELQRVLLYYALLGNPKILILDEPMQGLDINGETEIFTYLQHLNKEEKVAVFMVSHDLHTVFKESDQVICINHHICCHGHPTEVQSSKEYLDLFAPYHHRHTKDCHHE